MSIAVQRNVEHDNATRYVAGLPSRCTAACGDVLAACDAAEGSCCTQQHQPVRKHPRGLASLFVLMLVPTARPRAGSGWHCGWETERDLGTGHECDDRAQHFCCTADHLGGLDDDDPQTGHHRGASGGFQFGALISRMGTSKTNLLRTNYLCTVVFSKHFPYSVSFGETVKKCQLNNLAKSSVVGQVLHSLIFSKTLAEQNGIIARVADSVRVLLCKKALKNNIINDIKLQSLVSNNFVLKKALKV